jgi:hypothetical protein
MFVFQNQKNWRFSWKNLAVLWTVVSWMVFRNVARRAWASSSSSNSWGSLWSVYCIAESWHWSNYAWTWYEFTMFVWSRADSIFVGQRANEFWHKSHNVHVHIVFSAYKFERTVRKELVGKGRVYGPLTGGLSKNQGTGFDPGTTVLHWFLKKFKNPEPEVITNPKNCTTQVTTSISGNVP